MPRTIAACFVALAVVSSPVLAQTTEPTPPSGAVPAGESTPPAGARLAVPSWGSLFHSLGGDFRRLGSRDTAVILGVAGGISLGVRSHDIRLTQQAFGSEELDEVFESGAALGAGLTQIGGAFATYALGRATNHPRVAGVGAELVRAQIVSAALTQGLKVAVDRRRPDGGRFSFPSGHTSGAFAAATVMQRHLGWKVAVPAYGLAAYVAGSRLQENRHFMSDVVFGAAVGIVSGRAVTLGRGKGAFAVTPIAVYRGGGIGLTLVGTQ